MASARAWAMTIGGLAVTAVAVLDIEWAALAIAAFGLVFLSLPRPAALPDRGRYPENRFHVTFDSAGVTCTPPDGRVKHVRWADLIRLEVHTTSGGPRTADVWWVLNGRDGTTCEIPQGARGEKAFSERLLSLPGIDWKAFGAAMTCTDDRLFVCWQAGDHQAAVSPEA